MYIEAVDQARRRATGFLLDRRGPDGLWRDFSTLAGTSTDWVTGFVTWVLGMMGNGADVDIMTSRNILVCRQRSSGGWAYNAEVPPDADSTSWVLLALAGGPLWRPSAIVKAVRYLAQHQLPDGGFATYVPSDRIERYIGVPPTLLNGWWRSHPSVTAAVIQAFIATGVRPDAGKVLSACRWLSQCQRSDRRWTCYWWQGQGYPTWQAVRALSWTRNLDADTARGVADGISAAQLCDGSWPDGDKGRTGDAFETACHMLALAHLPTRTDCVVRAVNFLVDSQGEDGGWTPTPALRIPPPPVVDPTEIETWTIDEEGTGVVVTPSTGVFVTAAALAALQSIGSGAPIRTLAAPRSCSRK